MRRAGAKSVVRENRTTEIAGTLKESLKVRKARICAKASRRNIYIAQWTNFNKIKEKIWTRILI